MASHPEPQPESPASITTASKGPVVDIFGTQAGPVIVPGTAAGITTSFFTTSSLRRVGLYIQWLAGPNSADLAWFVEASPRPTATLVEAVDAYPVPIASAGANPAAAGPTTLTADPPGVVTLAQAAESFLDAGIYRMPRSGVVAASEYRRFFPIDVETMHAFRLRLRDTGPGPAFTGTAWIRAVPVS